MNVSFNDLCLLEFSAEGLEKIYGELSQGILEIGTFFKIKALPDELKLKICECSKEKFQKFLREKGKTLPRDSLAFTTCVNQIFALRYEEIQNECSINSYIKNIVHESAHVFQAYYSKILPYEYVWLYESVACLLAKQEKMPKSKKYASWEKFTYDFYNIDDCYATAYAYGKRLFEFYGEKISEAIKNPANHIDEMRMIYLQKTNPRRFSAKRS